MAAACSIPSFPFSLTTSVGIWLKIFNILCAALWVAMIVVSEYKVHAGVHLLCRVSACTTSACRGTPLVPCVHMYHQCMQGHTSCAVCPHVPPVHAGAHLLCRVSTRTTSACRGHTSCAVCPHVPPVHAGAHLLCRVSTCTTSACRGTPLVPCVRMYHQCMQAGGWLSGLATCYLSYVSYHHCSYKWMHAWLLTKAMCMQVFPSPVGLSGI